MKKAMFLLPLCLITSAYAAADLSVRGEMDSNNKNMSSVANGSPSLTTEMKDQRTLIKMSMAEKGYFESYSDTARFLLLLEKESSNKTLPGFTNEKGENDFVKHPKQLKLAVQKTFPPFIMKQKFIGASPVGFWIDDKKGWSGYKLFFRSDKNTVCSYSYFNLALSNGSVISNDNEAQLINGNHSANEVIGNNASGYNYSVAWFSPGVFKVLDCAQAKFNKNELNIVRNYAELIDKN